MKVLDVETPTTAQLERDLEVAVSEQFGMTLDAFREAVKSGKLSQSDDSVREIMDWLKFLPVSENKCPR